MRKDLRMRVVVTTFGALVLLTLLILIGHLLSQALPLALSPQFSLQQHVTAPPDNIFVGSADLVERQPAMTMGPSCTLNLSILKNDTLSPSRTLHRPCEQAAHMLTLAGEHYLATVSASGLVRLVRVQNLQPTPTGQPVLGQGTDNLPTGFSFALPPAIWAAQQQWQISLSEDWVVAIVTTADKQFVRWVHRRQPTRIRDQVFATDAKLLPLPNTRQLAVYQQQRLRFVSIDGDILARHSMPALRWWQTLPKNRTLLLTTETGRLTRWVLKNQQGRLVYLPANTLTLPRGTLPTALAAHPSNNALAITTDSNHLLLYNRISGEQVTDSRVPAQVNGISWYADRLYLFGPQDLLYYRVAYLSGVTTWASLFEPQIYEGYSQPMHIWQTSSASDYQEQKYSLVPLLMGSLKAALLALMIAIPLSVGAAIYTGFFARTRLRQSVKPAIEMLEAIPSVLIGFIAAIWLSPLAANMLFAIAFFLMTVPFLLLAGAMLQQALLTRFGRWRPGLELPLIILGILVLGYVSMAFASDGLLSLLGVADMDELTGQTTSPIGKTTIVVALALGIAISPSIYSLTEDAIAGVPDDLKHASFALGATRLQTLQRVVLHVARPGILAAIMFGFGRAFGETMIVLMVTGNTPIASWSLLEGLRALTANLAIELPEADVGSTHYQILFLTACILFAFTFAVNTVAELLRQRLRRHLRHD